MNFTRRNILSFAAMASIAPLTHAAETSTTKDMPQRKAPTNNTNFALPIERCWEIIEQVRHPIMGTADKEGIPYALPISTAPYDGKIYFHGVAGKGRKLANLTDNPYVSLVFVVPGHSEKPRLNINNESVIVFGKVRILKTDEEKLRASRILLRFQNPGISEAALDRQLKSSSLAITKALTWYEVVPEQITGKIIVHAYTKY